MERDGELCYADRLDRGANDRSSSAPSERYLAHVRTLKTWSPSN